jgi:hypothetical protein
MAKINIKDKIAEGAIYARLIFEIFGKPKENVDTAIKLLVENLKEKEDLKIIVEKYFDAEEKENMWSNFVELELLSKNMDSFLGLIVDFLPSSIEILEPEKVNINSNEIAGVLNDLTVKLTHMSNEYQKSSLESAFLKKKLNTLVSVMIIRTVEKDEKSLKDISEETRIEEQDLKPFIDDLVKNGKIEEKEGKYCLKC